MSLGLGDIVAMGTHLAFVTDIREQDGETVYDLEGYTEARTWHGYPESAIKLEEEVPNDQP
jgi:hypothetical protein